LERTADFEGQISKKGLFGVMRLFGKNHDKESKKKE